MNGKTSLNLIRDDSIDGDSIKIIPAINYAYVLMGRSIEETRYELKTDFRILNEYTY